MNTQQRQYMAEIGFPTMEECRQFSKTKYVVEIGNQSIYDDVDGDALNLIKRLYEMEKTDYDDIEDDEEWEEEEDALWDELLNLEMVDCDGDPFLTETEYQKIILGKEGYTDLKHTYKWWNQMCRMFGLVMNKA